MIKFLKRYNWVFPLLILFTLLLGALGFYQYGNLPGHSPNSWLTSLYLSLQLFVLNSGGVEGQIPLTLELARFLAPSLTAGGIFLALWEPFHQNFLMFRIRFWKNHIVVCGLSKKAELLIRNFLLQRGENYKIVVIELNPEHPSINHLRKKGIIFIHGNATHEEKLLRANILNAKYLLALTNDEDTNILIAHKATNIYNQFPKKILHGKVLQLIVHIDDYYTMNIFKEFHEKITPDGNQYHKEGSMIDYHAFSIFQLASAFMVDQFSPDKYGSLRNNEDPAAHILIIGNNIATEYLILEAAHMYHFANLKKTRITVITDEVMQLSEKLRTLHPNLEEVVDLRFASVINFFKDPCPIPCEEISLCFLSLDDDGKSIYYARKLRQHLFTQSETSKETSVDSFQTNDKFNNATPPIKVLLPRTTSLVNIFDDIVTELKSMNIELLNLDKDVCNKKTIVDNRKEEDLIARHIHYEWAKGQAQKTNAPIGSMQEEWDKLKDEQKDSNRLPARHLFFKLRFVNAEFSDVETGEELNFDTLEDSIWDTIARMEHNRWVAEKLINGFVLVEPEKDRKLGVFLKEKMKCHWDLVPFDQLDTETQRYDTFTFRMAPVIAQLNHKRILKLSIDH